MTLDYIDERPDFIKNIDINGNSLEKANFLFDFIKNFHRVEISNQNFLGEINFSKVNFYNNYYILNEFIKCLNEAINEKLTNVKKYFSHNKIKSILKFSEDTKIRIIAEYSYDKNFMKKLAENIKTNGLNNPNYKRQPNSFTRQHPKDFEVIVKNYRKYRLSKPLLSIDKSYERMFDKGISYLDEEGELSEDYINFCKENEFHYIVNTFEPIKYFDTLFKANYMYAVEDIEVKFVKEYYSIDEFLNILFDNNRINTPELIRLHNLGGGYKTFCTEALKRDNTNYASYKDMVERIDRIKEELYEKLTLKIINNLKCKLAIQLAKDCYKPFTTYNVNGILYDFPTYFQKYVDKNESKNPIIKNIIFETSLTY